MKKAGRPITKHLTKDQILNAMANTRTNMAAARYLGVSFNHYRNFAKMYTDNEGNTLFSKHKNLGAKGVPKLKKGSFTIENFPILDIIEGRIDVSNFTPDTIKEAMIREGLLREYCANCGFHERRVSDFRMPLILHFKDGVKTHYQIDNVKLFCYNCYFLTIGDVFNPKQILGLESHASVNSSQIDWKLDKDQEEMLNNITSRINESQLSSSKKMDDSDDAYSLVSRK